MTVSTKSLLRLLAILFSFALVAASCGSDGDSTADDDADAGAETDDGGDDDSGADDEAMDDDDDAGSDDSGDDDAMDDGAMADSDAAPVKIGLIAQDEELLAFPEVRAGSQAFVDYFNAEDGGAGGAPVELVVCGAGDTPESHVACAQEFANADDINIVISAGFLANSAAANDILAAEGIPTLTLGNDFIDYLTPGVFTVDPGLPGLAQVFFVFAAGEGLESATLFIADDPAFEPFIPALEAIAGANGITINEVVPLGFEPDLTGPVSAADTANDMWLYVLADGSQCSAAAAGVATVGYEGRLFANDLCMSEDVIASGDLDGWAGPIVSSAPVSDGGANAELINTVLDTYGSADAQNAGLSGWAIASTWVARDVLVEAGGADATRESALAALSAYSSSDVPGLNSVTCPGPSVWAGACNMAPLMVTVADGELTSPDGFVQLDFSELDFLLE